MYGIIKYEEGFREAPYLCSEGYVTIGYGTKLCNMKNADPEYFPIRVDKQIANLLLIKDCESIDEFLREYFSKVYINGPRYDVLASMCYQLGTYGFSKFKNMILAIHSEDWNKAADEALDSMWAKQTPNRAKRHSEVLRSGTLKVYSGYLN